MSPRSEGNGAGVPRTTTTKRTTRSTPTTLEVTAGGATVVLTPADLDKLTADDLRSSTPPASAARRAARSTPNRAGARPAARKARQAYSEADRAGALELLRDGGVALAHKELGIPKATLSRWAASAGIDLGEGTRERTAAATAGRVEQVERARLTTVQLLEAQVQSAGEVLVAVSSASAEAAFLIAELEDDQLETRFVDGELVVDVHQRDAKAALKRAQVLGTLPVALRDVVGLQTRAIHDLALLRGEATERGQLIVELTVPRANPAASDAAAIDQDQLPGGGAA